MFPTLFSLEIPFLDLTLEPRFYGLFYAIDIHEAAPCLRVGMFEGLVKREHWRKADVRALHDFTPLTSRFFRE